MRTRLPTTCAATFLAASSTVSVSSTTTSWVNAVVLEHGVDRHGLRVHWPARSRVRAACPPGSRVPGSALPAGPAAFRARA